MISIKKHSKPAFILIFLLLSFSGKPERYDTKSDIAGIWLTQSGESMIQISKVDKYYNGTVYWLKFPISPYTGKAKVDIKNPDPKKRSIPIIGLNILINFKYSAEKKTGEGNIYDPKSGTTYNCSAELTEANTLKIRGYIGASWMGLGRTEIWKRIK